MGGGSPEEEGARAEWRRVYDQVEALAADGARLETANEALRARLLQAEASRRRWKTAYIELPLLANPKIAELQEKDLEDSSNCEAPIDTDLSRPKKQLKGGRRHVELSQNNTDHGDIARDLRAALRKLKQAYEDLSSKKDQKAIEAAEKLQRNMKTSSCLRAGAVDAENKETIQKRRKDSSKMDLDQCTIFVKFVNDERITLKVTQSDTIYSVKAKIEDKEGIPAGHQRLIFDNQQLVGSCTLKDYNIKEKSTLDLVFRGMHIFVETPGGMNKTLEVGNADTIYSVKAKMFDETGYVPEMQRIIFDGRQLEEARTLADYDIQNDSTLRLALRPWGLNDRRHISVRTVAGRTIIRYCAMSSETVSNVKDKIYVELGIPVDQQCLSWGNGGAPLENGCTMEETKRHLVLQLRLPGGQ